MLPSSNACDKLFLHNILSPSNAWVNTEEVKNIFLKLMGKTT